MALDPYFSKTALLIHGETTDPDGGALVAGYSGGLLTPELGTAYVQNSPVPGSFDGYPALKLAATSSLWAYGSQTGVFNGDFTVELWFYQTSYNAFDVFFAACAGTTNTYQGCYVYYSASGGNMYLLVRGSNISVVTPRPSLNAWHHLAITSSGGNCSLYIDGARVAFGVLANNTTYNACNGGRAGYTNGLSSAGIVGYVSDLRIYKGVAKAAGETYPVPARPGLPYGAQLDSSPKGRSVGGGGVVASPYTANSKFGGASIRFDGASYLECAASSDWLFGTGDFTVEAWAFVQGSGVRQAVVSQWNNVYDESWSLSVGNGNDLCFMYRSGSTDYYIGTYPFQLPLGQWVHLAVSRQGANLRLFVDGVLRASRADLAGKSVGKSATVLRVGRAVAVNDYFTGLVDDVRITKGVARYTENFTPPTQAFPNGQATVTGVVRDVDGNLCSRRVFVHSRATGRLLGTAVSDPVTGVYEIAAEEVCYAVCLDADGSYNAKVVDGVDPTA